MKYNFEWNPDKANREKKGFSMKDKEIKREYDFSKGVRGNFFNQKATRNLPVYPDSDVAEFPKKISRKKAMMREKQ